MKQLTQTIKHALCMPDEAGAYHIAHYLSEIFPRSEVRSTCDRNFKLDYFLRYGLGEGKSVDRLWPHLGLTYRSKVHEYPLQTWRSIEYCGSTIEVVTAILNEGTRHFLISQDLAVLEAFFAAVCRFTQGTEGEILLLSEGSVSRDKELEDSVETSNWESLILDESIKLDLLQQCSAFFENEALYRNSGVRWRRGILLTGPPGNGKTQFLRALVKHLGKRTIVVKNLTDYCDSSNVTESFEEIRRRRPCLVLMEDLDSLVPANALSEFLNELDGTKSLDGVLILATTNHPEKLDPALKNRPSRFDRIVEFGPPVAELRREYFKRTFPDGTLTESDLDSVVETTEGLSFAMLNEVRISALFQRVYDPKMSLSESLSHFASVVREQFEARPTVEDADDE